MMKRIWVVIFVAVMSLPVWGQGWRQGEMEVRVAINQASDIEKLQRLGLDFEPATTDGSAVRLYLIPEELNRLKDNKFDYTITIPDLNAHYAHFWDNPAVPPGYYTYEQIIAIIDSLADNFPSICKKENWGSSLGERELAALKISDNVGTDEAEPEIMFDGGIHGDEVGCSQNVIMFARDLCLGYGSDPVLTDLIDSREIWLYPMVNPDGRAYMSRYNSNGVDCNRDNGYMWNAEGNSYGAFSQVETKALRNALVNNQFVVYTNYHSGIEIISYPWSYRSSPPRDHAHLSHMASVYSSASGYTSLQYGQGYNVMYAINGSTKDFQYGSLGNVGWSIEISALKQPPSSQIGFYYNANKPAMIELISACGNGVSGMITDSLTGQPVRATVWVNDLFPVYNDPEVGDYHKYLIPGTYSIRVTANGYQPKTITNAVVPLQGSAVKDFQLVPATNYFAYKVMSCRIPGNNYGDEGYTPGALGVPDSVPYSLGKNGWIVLDMGDTIHNAAGNDFRVIQSGITDKEFTVSGSNYMDGPFTLIGTGSGTTEFDLESVSLTKIRYLHIKDNGAGPAYGSGAGFNLDAVEILTLPVSSGFEASDNTPCAGTYIHFTDNSTGNPTTWEWSFTGGLPSSSNAQNPGNILYMTPGGHNVSLTVSNGFSADSITMENYIHVESLPMVNLGNDTAMCAWNTLVLDAGNPGGSYLWSTGDTTQTIVADTSGTGYGTGQFWVSVRNSNDCAGSDTISITFDNCTGLHQPTVAQSVTVAPNPSTGRIVIEIRGFERGEWQIYSITGVMVGRSAIKDNHYLTSLDLGSMPDGLYYLKVQKDQTVMVSKILLTGTAGR